jgi:predicted ATPase
VSHLARFSVAGFQSYSEEQSATIDPRLTFLAGRNNVGKSAFLRALRVFAESQEGAAEDFSITFEWVLSQPEMVEGILPGTTESRPLEDWLRQHDEHTFVATFVRASQESPVHGGLLFCNAIELREAGAIARGSVGSNLGWESGPFAGSGAGSTEFTGLATKLASQVSHIAPRRVEQGLRQLYPRSALTPEATNLADVVAHLQLNQPTTTFARLVEFMREAFPEIETLTVRTNEASGTPPQAEPTVVYRHDPSAFIPLRLSGSGVEQMLALAVALLIAPPGRLFLIDEPQAYLHPHAERSLLELLDNHPEHQYVIATNSSLLLNSRPLAQSRLLTINEGSTTITEFPSRDELLNELGITAADLWLAERVLWVEGASEVEVVEALAGAELSEAERAGLAIRAMPDAASRFTSRSPRRAEATYRFCADITAAVSPLQIQTLFLFDNDEKDEEARERIRQASSGHATFLEVRELENMFLHDELVHEGITALCEDFEITPPSREQVAGELDSLLELTDDRELFPQGLREGADPRAEIRGSRALERIYWQFATSEYDKVRDGRALTDLALKNHPEVLDPLRRVLSALAHPIREHTAAEGSP